MAAVLLIGCGNLAGLFLVRASGRGKELALRAALGATRRHLVGHLLVEALLLSLAGGAIGLLLASLGLKILVALSPTALPRAQEIALDGPVLLFTLGASLAAGLIFGAGPAIRAARSDLGSGMKRAGANWDRPAAGTGRRLTVRGLLVVAEVALALVLLAGAGLFLRSFQRVQTVDPGFDPDRLLIARLSLPRGRYSDAATLVRFHESLSERLRSLPGVESVGVVSLLPLSGLNATTDFTVVEHPPLDPSQVPAALYRVADADYFRTLRIRMVRGRAFTSRDNAQAVPAVIINEHLASRFFPGEDPVGMHINLDDTDEGPRRVEIVGVAADVKQMSLDAGPSADVYVPFLQAHAGNATWLANNQFWILKCAVDPMLLASSVRSQVHAIDAEVPASNVRSMQDYLADSVGLRRFNTRLLAAFATAALALAATGIYGLIAYSVAQRTREFGIRMALGARPRDLLRQVLDEGLRLTFLGVVFGLLGALALTRLLEALLFGVSAFDPVTFGAVPLLLAAAAGLASYLPARRASLVDPAMALRSG